MSRLIFVPQFPTRMRYQETWFSVFPEKFKEHFDEVIVLGKDTEIGMEQGRDQEMFSSIDNAIYFEQSQIVDFLNIKLRSEDILFLADTSFPGFFANVLYHKPVAKMYAYTHATSLNYGDYFEKVRYSKYPCEVAHSKLFKTIFVGSEYHKKKLGWNNTKVVGLPIPPHQTFKEKKKYEIISVARPNNQKVTKYIEDQVERDFCRIERQTFNSWEEYYKFLSQGKILLITSKEDTFNYSILEASMNGTVVLAPRRCSFPELLNDDYLYNDWDDLRNKIWYYLKNNEPQEKLLNQELCDNFYENIISEIKK